VPEPRRFRIRSLAALGLAIAAGLGAFLRTRPPRPAEADAAPDRFSAIRAHAVLARILGGGLPHPEGSREAENMRERIIVEFRALGDTVETRRDFACGRNGACGDVVNLVVRRPGSPGRKAILFTAHSDSVAAGPGASDDASGVAALLEVARALSRSPTRRPLVFLIDDGEEQGLLGAEAFAAAADLRRDFLGDINVEARGTTGASILFETSENNAWLARLFGALPHPYASSLFYFVYKTLPNDTDLTVLRAHGAQGVNLGCIGGVTRYHTPRDDLAHADPATLQHHGDNALALARALDSLPGDDTPRGDAVFFDIFGALVARWPEGATVPAASVAALILVVGVLRRFRMGSLTRTGVTIGLAIFPAALAAGAVAAEASAAILRRAGALPAGWVAHPFPAAASVWAAALAAAIGAGGWLARRADARNAEAGVAAVWAAVALVLAAKAPGTSYLFLIPALLFAAAVLVGTGDSERAGWAAEAFRAGGAIASGFFLIPVAAVLLDAIGFRGVFAIGALLGIVTTAFSADLARVTSGNRRRIWGTIAAAAVVAFLTALRVAPFTRDSPQRVSILLAEDSDTGSARWIVETDADTLPPALRRAAAFRLEPEFPWFPGDQALSTRASAPPLASPALNVREDVVADGTRRIKGTLVSPRGAPLIRIAFPPGSRFLGITIGGRPLAPVPETWVRRAGGWRSYRVVTLRAEGIPVEITARPGPLAFVLADRSGELPESAHDLVAARPGWAVPSQSGDGTIVVRRVKI
jgi:hypothetical protein